MGHISTVHYEECKVSLTAWKFKKCTKDTVDHTWHWRSNKKENILYFDYNIRTKSYMKQHIFNTLNKFTPNPTIHQKEKSVSSWELNHKEGWALKNWCFWTVMMEKTLENSLNCKEIKSIHPKGNQSWIFIERTDVEAEIPILWATWWEEPTQRRPWCWERLKAGGEGMTEDEMVEWHYWLNGHEFEQAPGDGEGLGSLACCSSWGPNESDMTEQLHKRSWELGADLSEIMCPFSPPVWFHHQLPEEDDTSQKGPFF